MLILMEKWVNRKFCMNVIIFWQIIGFTSFHPYTAKLFWRRWVNIFKLFIFFSRSKIIKILLVFLSDGLEFLLLFLSHFLQWNKFKLWCSTYVGFSKIIYARMTVDQKWLINTLIVVILRWNLCGRIMRVLSDFH